MPKPGDFFLGLYEFFSILVPGALLLIVFIVLLQDQYVAFNVPTAANWAVFLLLSYLTGHLLQIPADLIDKIVYDRFYVKRKRRQPDRLFNRAKCVVARRGRN